VICTGNPLRKAFVEYAARAEVRQIPEQNINILIIGGSQGAKILNEVVPEAVALLDLPNIEVKHQTGKAMQVQVADRYQVLDINANAPAFINDMVAVYQWADILICRAGAMTVSEVAAIGIPAIFVPLPNAIDDHQTANAKYLTDAGAGVLLLQKDLTADTLAKNIMTLLTYSKTITLAAKQLARLDATDVVVAYCTEVAK
jgi:UDP-N-acetylglucosamine--N-acetylmuramyl-(pentapeptide) pyrophosphoryl-undecaprenol N-acetylglucosamine transferase